MKPIQISFIGAFLLLVLFLARPSGLNAASHPLSSPFSAMATLSCRGAKPGDRVELLVTVRNALHPTIDSVERPPSFRMRTLRKPRLVKTGDGDVWLFRYQIIPTENGDFEIPSITVTDSSLQTRTTPLRLLVTLKGDAPALTPGELSRTVNLPTSLSEEVMKNVPQKAPKLEASSVPADTRPLPARIGSTLLKEIQAFWNYPGGK